MTTKTTLYRLLRDEEKNPLEYGITAKLPYANKTPLEHIRYGSRKCEQSQWISTSRSLSDVKVLIGYKRRKEGRNKMCRVVEIDEQKLLKHEHEFEKLLCEDIYLLKKLFKRFTTDDLIKVFARSTGDVLDFTDPSIMDKYIPNNFRPDNVTARGYAKRYSEVLVKRHIPAECCIRVIDL